MPNFKVGQDNGTDVVLNYIDYGTGKPVVLIHGWPLSLRMWEHQIPALVDAGFRVIAYDRRGFGQSSQPWGGYDYDTFAADLKALLEGLDVKDAALVGFSMGGGEVARYIGTYGTDNISKAVLMSAVTPLMIKTEANPDGVDGSVIEGIKGALMSDRLAFLNDFGRNFYNWDTDGKDLISQGVLDYSWNIASLASPKGTLDCVTAFSATDFTEDLKKFDIATLVMHGDADQIVPYETTGKLAHAAIPESELAVIAGAAHGMTFTRPDDVNKALLAFLST